MQLCEDKLIYKLTLVSYTAVNSFPGLVHTARHTMEAGYARSRYSNLFGGGCLR